MKRSRNQSMERAWHCNIKVRLCVCLSRKWTNSQTAPALMYPFDQSSIPGTTRQTQQLKADDKPFTRRPPQRKRKLKTWRERNQDFDSSSSDFGETTIWLALKVMLLSLLTVLRVSSQLFHEESKCSFVRGWINDTPVIGDSKIFLPG